MTTFREYRERQDGPDPVEHFAASIPPDARPFQGDRAGFVSRSVAAGIDVTLVFIVVLCTVAALWMLSYVFNPTGSSSAWTGRVPPALLFVLYGYFLNWIYWTVCWATSGRTIGNLIMGLRVVNFRGKHLRWSGAAVRSLFCTTVPIGLLWVIVSRANRSVQDVVMRTSVIYDWPSGMPKLGGILGRRTDG
jgi:uncharacterized RDD family membrane protein YckC